MESGAEINGSSNLFDPNSYWYRVILISIFILAALFRRDEIQAPGHLIEREYSSAIFARAFYNERNPSIELWRQENARLTMNQLTLLEPPVTEYIVSWMYQVLGSEEIWYSRFLTTFFWLLGGYFYYRSVRILISDQTAFFAVVYYLFVPWGVIISRSFQPDSLMMMMFLISLYSILLYFKQPSWKRLILCAVITGLTLLFRPLVLFILFGAFIALSIHQKKLKAILDPHFIIFCILSLSFPLVFYGNGIYISGYLSSQADLSFRPWLLTRWEFWLGWLKTGTIVAVPSIVIAALVGFFLLRNKFSQALIIGMAIGYFIFGLFFTFHVHTHPYYHIQLFPLIGISASPFLVNIGITIKNALRNNWWILASAIILFSIFTSYTHVRGSLYNKNFENPHLAREIGQVVNHSARTVMVAYHYGVPLMYYGEFSGVPWPVRIDDPFYRKPDAKELSVRERLESLGFEPEYFIITNFSLFNRKHQDLQTYLEAKCSIHAQTDKYLIYGSCQTSAAGQSALLP
jgi:4-amino-4-deoxy-L-arabinose transferase-like glycosyltransferase